MADANTVTITKEDWDKMNQKVDGMVGDIQNERKLRQDAEAARDLAIAEAEKAKNNPPPPEPDAVTQKVQEELSKRDKEAAEAASKNALVKFQNAHKEFHPDNDAGGIKFAAFKNTLGRFNTSAARTESDFTAVYEDALRLLNPGSSTTTTIKPDASTTRTSTSEPSATEGTQLSTKEQALIKQMNWDEKRYLAIKEKRPGYVNSLLALIQD